MKVVTEFPHSVRTLEHEWITMSDGCRLAAKLWIPEQAESQPVPAILEYIPYRKNDGTAVRDHSMHSYFAGHGYGSVRVDMRGSGDSDGILADEYLPLEQEDGLEVIRWLVAQPWCSGTVGMIGISWGGFVGLQLAARSPAELGAVISVCSTDDRYADDVHYMGGAAMGSTALGWATVMLGYNARPPDPQVVGESWRRTWLARMEQTPPYVEAWLSHQRRDEFWRHGSVCEDYSSIRCPVYMVGGFQDAYRNAILRFLERHPGPCKGLIGPWGHRYPHEGVPGPAIGFLQECLRFYDHCLKGVENGIMEEPKLRLFLQDPIRPTVRSIERSGRWINEPGWPSRDLSELRFFPTASHRLDVAAPEPSDLVVSNDTSVGIDAGPWCGYGGLLDNPGDQRREDGLSLSFESEPMLSDTPIVGSPRARLEVSSDRPFGMLAVRLCHLWPDGGSTLITRGVLNLTHRESDEHPEDLEPGRRYTVDVPLNAISYVVPNGHRIRLALSTSYWPMIWPAPGSAIVTLHAGISTTLFLPVYTGQGYDDPPEHFGQPERAPYLTHEILAPDEQPLVGRVIRRLGSGTTELVTGKWDPRLVRLSDSGLAFGETYRFVFRIAEDDPLSAMARCEQHNTLSRGDWRIRVEATSTMAATAKEFQVTTLVDAYEGDQRVFTRAHTTTIAREFT